jgi:hypothetical protein
MKRRDFLAGLAGSVPATAFASQTGQRPGDGAVPPKRLTITLLGTGTPAPSLVRQGSGYLIEVGRDTIVMDHGPGAHHRLLESSRQAIDVTHAFFTHLHYDHCLDYARLVLQRWDQGAGKIPELNVYGPPPIARMTNQLFGEEGVYGPDIRARVQHQSSLDVFTAQGGTIPRRPPTPRVKEVHAGDVVEGRDWKITVGHAAHVQPYLECLAFRLDCAYGSVCSPKASARLPGRSSPKASERLPGRSSPKASEGWCKLLLRNTQARRRPRPPASLRQGYGCPPKLQRRRERSGAIGAPASDGAGGSGGAKPPGQNEVLSRHRRRRRLENSRAGR